MPIPPGQFGRAADGVRGGLPPGRGSVSTFRPFCGETASMKMPAHDASCETEAEAIRAWIADGQNGSPEARGKLFERCRDYLLLVARRNLATSLQGKVGASDLVQQTFIDANRAFGDFHGDSEPELLAWLKRILQNHAAQAVRRYLGAAKRDVRIERSLFGCRGDGWNYQVAADAETPSRQLAAAEQSDALTAALSRLPRHYKQVIEWRNYERKPFEQIGAMLDRSPEAARNLWVRAIERLRVELGIAHESQTKP